MAGRLMQRTSVAPARKIVDLGETEIGTNRHNQRDRRFGARFASSEKVSEFDLGRRSAG
jgi:hypothetical protein